MINAGINIFVNEYTDKYIGTCSKVWIVYLVATRTGSMNKVLVNVLLLLAAD